MYEVYDLSKLAQSDEKEWELCKFYLETEFTFYYFLAREKFMVEQNVYRQRQKVFDLQKCQTKSLLDVVPHTSPVPKRVLYRHKANECNLAYFLVPKNNIYVLQDC